VLLNYLCVVSYLGEKKINNACARI